MLVKSRDAFSGQSLVCGTLTISRLKGQDGKRRRDQAARVPVLPADSPHTTSFRILPYQAPALCVRLLQRLFMF